MLDWLYKPDSVKGAVAFALIIGLLLVAVIFAKDYFLSLRKRQELLRKGFDILPSQEPQDRSDDNIR